MGGARIDARTGSVLIPKPIPRFRGSVVLPANHYLSKPGFPACHLHNHRPAADRAVLGIFLLRYGEIHQNLNGFAAAGAINGGRFSVLLHGGVGVFPGTQGFPSVSVFPMMFPAFSRNCQISASSMSVASLSMRIWAWCVFEQLPPISARVSSKITSAIGPI